MTIFTDNDSLANPCKDQASACDREYEESHVILGHSLIQTSGIRHALVDYKILDPWDVVGASPAGAAPTTSSLST